MMNFGSYYLVLHPVKYLRWLWTLQLVADVWPRNSNAAISIPSISPGSIVVSKDIRITAQPPF